MIVSGTSTNMSVNSRISDSMQDSKEVQNMLDESFKQKCAISNVSGIDFSHPFELPKSISSSINSTGLTDVTINIGDRIFHAHKVVLAKSSVFETKLMSEGPSGTINIEEIDPIIFEELLFYMYHNQIRDPSKVSVDLCSAADYYGLPELCEICEKYVKENLSMDNVFQVLNYAESKDRQNLLDATCRFLISKRSKWTKEEKEKCLKSLPLAVYAIKNYKS